MNIDLTSLSFNSIVNDAAGTPSWGTSLGQGKGYKINIDDAKELLSGLIYCGANPNKVHFPAGKGGKDIQEKKNEFDVVNVAIFNKVFINNCPINKPFILSVVREHSESHDGRLTLKYSYSAYYDADSETISNESFFDEAKRVLNYSEKECWFIYKIEIHNQTDLHMFSISVDNDVKTYENSAKRKEHWLNLITENLRKENFTPIRDYNFKNDKFPDILSAIRTKPFLLLAGISGTGKSRLVRELARAVNLEGSGLEQLENFLLVPVKPNWHDSSELLGYVSRISGTPKYNLTSFIRFLVKAWAHKDVPFFVCLDEMNLAPVEQYFAEYLSVIETRKQNADGEIVSEDALVIFDEDVQEQIKNELGEEFCSGIKIPPNLIVMGTVNMDETTCSFSRKVLDRAMTFELNKVNTNGILSEGFGDVVEEIPTKMLTAHYVKPSEIKNAEDVLKDALEGLNKINEQVLNNTPFKIAYRSFNEILLYIYERSRDGTDWHVALDEAILMKILPRIEGESDKVKSTLEKLKNVLSTHALYPTPTGVDDTNNTEETKAMYKKTLDKIELMLRSGDYISFWGN